jgi:hypothetical protein
MRDHLRAFASIKVVASSVEAPPALVRRDDFVIVERGIPRLALFHCPCGCGDVVTLNLDSRAGKSWRLLRRDRTVTLRPSIWRDTGCQSHFAVWGSRILFARPDWRRQRQKRASER